VNDELPQDVAALTDTVKRFTLKRIAPHVPQHREVKVMMTGAGAEEIMKDLAARQSGL
jgi:hypothetical protein